MVFVSLQSSRIEIPRQSFSPQMRGDIGWRLVDARFVIFSAETHLDVSNQIHLDLRSISSKWLVHFRKARLQQKAIGLLSGSVMSFCNASSSLLLG